MTKLSVTSLLLAGLLAGSVQAYTVQPGDTLYSLARKSGLSVEDLMNINNLSSPSLSVGQELRLGKDNANANIATKAPDKGMSVSTAIQTAPQVTPSPSVTLPAPKATVSVAAPLPSKPNTKPSALTSAVAHATGTSTPATSTTRDGQTGSSGLNQNSTDGESGILSSTGSFKVGTVTVKTPTSLRMGSAFSIVLSGEGAAAATVRFPSELGEDVRRPNEMLTPYGAANVYTVPGRVVLGKTTPVTVEVRVGDKAIQRQIRVENPSGKPVQHLNLPPAIGKKLKDPGKLSEDALVNTNYERRTQPQWTRPFSPPLDKLVVTSSFGSSRTYVAGGPVVYHYGADYPAPAGTAIHAVNDGVVVIAATYPVRGGFVMIDHGGGVSSLYFHQSKVLAKVGQVVRRGDIIGKVGATGLADGAHLHLEIRVRGEATNPTDWFGKLWP